MEGIRSGWSRAFGLLSALSLTAGAAGCMQNPTVTIPTEKLPREKKSEGSPVPPTTTTNGAPAGQPQEPTETPAPAPAPVPAPSVAPSAAPSPAPSPVPTATPTPRPTLFTAAYFARPLGEEEKALLGELPYRSTKRRKVRTLNLGGYTGSSLGGIPYVRHGQVLLAIDLVNLPPQGSITRIHSLDLKLYLLKLARILEKKRDRDSEVLCFVPEQACSGKLTTSKRWKKTINPEFFPGTGGAQPANTYFSERWIGDPIAWVGLRKLYGADATLEIEKLLEHNPLGIVPLELLYGDRRPAGMKDTLYIAVADETYVAAAGAQLEVTLTYQEGLK